MAASQSPTGAPGIRRGPLVRLLRRLRPIRWQAAGAYGAMLLASAISVVVPLFLRDVVDAAIGERPDALGFLPEGLGDRDRLLVGAGIVVVLAIVRAVVSFWQRYGTAWVGRTVATDLRGDLVDHLLDSELAFHDRASTGQLMTRITDDTEQVRAFAATGVADLANIAALLVGTSVLLWSVDPVLAPIALGAVPIVAAMAIWGARLLTPRFLELQQARGGLSARLQESLTQVRVVQAFDAEGRTADRYVSDNEVVFERRIGLAQIFTSVFPAMSAVLGVATAAVLLVGGWRVADGVATVGTIVAFTGYIVLLGEPVRRLGFLLNLASRATASAERVFELLDRVPGMAPPANDDRSGVGRDGPTAGHVATGSGGVTLAWEDVRFAYDDEPVLHDIDLRVEAGEHVAIVGRSGSGKSTLVALLNRLYDPDEGRVTVDGTDVRELSRRRLRELVAVVEQDAWLFSASVADNIRFARSDATDGEVERAARAAGAYDFVDRFDDRFDTLVGERGVTLSGGQRQRVALARAMLVDAPVLVLDDAVSAVDASTEDAIRDALGEVEAAATIVSVAQRLSTVLAADRIVVLDRGRIVEQGTHDDLVDAGGVYTDLFGSVLGGTTGDAAAVPGGRR